MREFFDRTVEKADVVQQREAVLRFITLWKCRYKVWPSVGEKGQKKFNASRGIEERQVILLPYTYTHMACSMLLSYIMCG